MKRKISLILLLTTLIMLCLSSCNLVKSGTMRKIKGTYELIDYSRTYAADMIPEGSDTLVDYRVQDEIKMYLIIDGSGEGTVVYESADTGLFCYKVSVTYTYDTEETNKISYVNYKSAGALEDDKSILHYEQLAVFATLSDVSLSYTTPKLTFADGSIKTHYTDYIKFEKVSRKTDLSYAAKKFSAEIPPPTDMSRFDD